MKRYSFILIVSFICTFVIFSIAYANSYNFGYNDSKNTSNFQSPFSSKNDVHVNGHIRSDGAYVPDHYRTRPNDTKRDNWSTRGNINPYTGKKGTKSPW